MNERFEYLLPTGLEKVLADCPVAYVPLGTLEFHGWHMPFGFDALKAHALCLKLCERNGGTVLPPTFHGFEGAHGAYVGSIISREELVRGNLEITLERLVEMGFKVLVVLTGHYPNQQMDLARDVAAEVAARHPGVRAIGLAEPQVVEDQWKGDHAAKYETSIGMAMLPECVHMEELDKRDDPLHGIYGDDPRTQASAELGRETIEEFLDLMSGKIEAMKRESGIHHER